MSVSALRVAADSRRLLRAGLPALGVIVLGMASALRCADAAPPDSVATSGADSTGSESPAAATLATDDAFHDGAGLDGFPISAVEIHPLNVYEPVPAGRLGGFYRLANRLHIRTRRDAIRSQLLFGPGDRWSDARGRELARNLRALDFLYPVRIEPVRAGDSVKVDVETRDLWTTAPEFNFESSGGRKYGALAFTEKNFAGRAKSMSLSWRHDPIGVTRAVSYVDPNVRGSRLRLKLASGRGSEGASSQFMLGEPFWALDTRRSYGVAWDRITSNAVLYQRSAEVASLNQKSETTELWWAQGGWKDSTIRRFTYSLLLRDKRLGPTVAYGLEQVPPEFEGGEESSRLRRLAVEMRLWHPRYAERVGVDQMDLVEDFDLGAALALKAGYSPDWFGGEDEGYVRVQLDRGANTPFGFGWARGSIESRLRDTPKETLHRLDARWIYQSFGRQTAVLAAHGVAGLQMDRDFQAVVGGLNGLRAYPVQAVAGRRLWRFNAEDRWKVGNVFREFLTVGVVGFVDAARAWGSGSGGAEWFVDSGFGLRLTAPQWTLGRVVRIDFAWPVNPTRDARRQPVVSFGSSQAF